MLVNGAYFDKRLIPHHKKKFKHQKQLPQIKQPIISIKKINHNFVSDIVNARMSPMYPLLSSVLISKKIGPPPPMSKLLAVIQEKDTSSIMHNFNFRKQSVQRRRKEIVYTHKSQHKRCNTSLSRHKNQNQEQKQNQLEQILQKEVKRGKQIKFMISGSNNNQELVRSLLQKRKGWREIAQGEGLADIKWIFYKAKHNFKKMSKYARKRIVNHFEFNHQICSKDLLIKNLQMYCETKKIELFSITPLTFILDFDNQFCNFHLKQFINFYTKNDTRTQKNQVPNGFLYRLQCYMAHQNPFIKKIINYLSKPINYTSYYSEQSYIWLLKPTGLNRGRGIELFNSLQQLQQLLIKYFELMGRKKHRYLNENFQQKRDKELNARDESEYRHCGAKTEENTEFKEQQTRQKTQADLQHTNESKLSTDQKMFTGQAFQLQNCSFVIQKYVQRPLLISGRKFDIRVWALLTDQLELYFYKSGYLRLATQQYSTDDLMNPFVHLTNNAIQKQSPNYGQYEDGNQLPFQYLSKQLGETQMQHIWGKMKQITHMAFSSVKKKINLHNRQHCFEIFGLDFMIDYQKRVWLIEVNQNPCIECSSPLLGELIPKMVDGALALTVDAILRTNKQISQAQKKASSEWQLLGQLKANCTYKIDQ